MNLKQQYAHHKLRVAAWTSTARATRSAARLFSTALAIALLVASCTSSPALAQLLTGNLGIHDPSSVMKLDGRYYVFATGNRTPSKVSDDRINWSAGPTVFSSAPSWVASAVPNNRNANFWAPDVAFFNNQYHLYYSVSTFGSQDSAIGLVTNPTLNPASPNYQWTDHGPVIQSNPGQNPFNAIDPAIIQTSAGEIWMSFGSFWNGLYMTQLDPATGMRISPNSPTISIARHLPLNPNAIEAPYIHERDGFYYLFVNWDTCCQELNSTYNIRVGRSTSVTGPYFDRNGVNMVSGGGTLFLGTEGNFIGPGHISIFTDAGIDWFGYHYYDGATTNGTPKYNIRTVNWDQDGWPTAGPAFAALPGDVNLDGHVDLEDFYILSDNLSLTGASWSDGDLNNDEVVNYFDFHIWKSYYEPGFAAGESFAATVPEPSAWLLVVFAMICRPRRCTRSFRRSGRLDRVAKFNSPFSNSLG